MAHRLHISGKSTDEPEPGQRDAGAIAPADGPADSHWNRRLPRGKEMSKEREMQVLGTGQHLLPNVCQPRQPACHPSSPMEQRNWNPVLLGREKMYHAGDSAAVFGWLKTIPPATFHRADFQSMEGVMDVSRSALMRQLMYHVESPYGRRRMNNPKAKTDMRFGGAAIGNMSAVVDCRSRRSFHRAHHYACH